MISIIDYGLGNICAIGSIYKQLNIPYQFVRDKESLLSSEKIILPGVGSFDHAMKMLDQSGLRETLNQLVIQHGIPVLGICVGMQMLAESSEEGILPGLGWIKGKVKRIDSNLLNENEPLPHMGWNNLHQNKESKIFSNIKQNAPFYFLHSYYFENENNEDAIGSCFYGKNFTCCLQSENIYGIQCHPEKSHAVGIQFFKNFGEL